MAPKKSNMSGIRKGFFILIPILLALFTSIFPKQHKDCEVIVHFIDVGQADSILIQESGGKNMLIDAGNNSDEDIMVNYIYNLGIQKLDYVIGTHPHEDHIGGLDAVIEAFDVGKIIMPKVSANTKTFEDVLTAIKNKGLKVTTAMAGMVLDFNEDIEAEILAPNSSEYSNTNDYSVVMKLTLGNTSFLFTGDAEADSEKEMLLQGYNLKSDVLKVGHHGSITSSTVAFIKEVSPKYSVISVGENNQYNHPDSIVLKRLESYGEVYRTDELGTIIMISDGKTIRLVEGEKHETNN